MRPVFKTLSFLLLSILMANCDQSVSVNTNDLAIEDPIVGGQIVAPAENSSTVSIIYKEKEKPLYLCTGIVISENLILTAAHCVPPTEPEHFVVGFLAQIQDPFGKDNIEGRGTVVDFRVNPLFEVEATATNNAHDMAILKIVGPLPEGFKPTALPVKEFTIEKSDSLEMWGFGRTGEKSPVDGALRAVQVPATQITDSVKKKIPKQQIEIELAVPGVIALEQPEKGICQADSGGPLFSIDKDGNRTLVGVAVAGTNNKNIFKNCHGQSLFVDVRQKLDWIQKTIEEFK